MINQIERSLDKYLGFFWAKRQSLLRYYLKSRNGRIGDDLKESSKSPVSTPEQFTILSILDAYGHGVPIKDIASQINIPHANVSRTLDRLEKRGLIRRTPGKEDKRAVYIHLSLEGKRAAKFVGEVERRLHTEMWSALDEAEKQTLYKLLTKAI